MKIICDASGKCLKICESRCPHETPHEKLLSCDIDCMAPKPHDKTGKCVPIKEDKS